MALTIEEAEAKIKFYEEQKELIAKRDTDIPAMLETLTNYSKVLTTAQRRRIAKIIGAQLEDDPSAPAKKATKKAAKKGTVAPKFRLPSGDEWSGRGLTPNTFKAWEKTAEGKAWQAANPDEKFPLIDGQSAPAKKAAKKTTKKATKKRAKKAARKVAKKRARKVAKKAS